jgi:DNA-binding NtrC family response regulator
MGDRVVLLRMEPRVARILIVEDEPALIRLYGRALEAAGYRVQGAGDGDEALRLIRSESFDAIVSDICMPGLGGVDIARECRRICPQVPVLLMTARLDADVYSQARDAGVVRYILKPVALEQLARAVDNAVKLRAALQRQAERKNRPATDR